MNDAYANTFSHQIYKVVKVEIIILILMMR